MVFLFTTMRGAVTVVAVALGAVWGRAGVTGRV